MRAYGINGANEGENTLFQIHFMYDDSPSPILKINSTIVNRYDIEV